MEFSNEILPYFSFKNGASMFISKESSMTKQIKVNNTIKLNCPQSFIATSSYSATLTYIIYFYFSIYTQSYFVFLEIMP